MKNRIWICAAVVLCAAFAFAEEETGGAAQPETAPMPTFFPAPEPIAPASAPAQTEPTPMPTFFPAPAPAAGATGNVAETTPAPIPAPALGESVSEPAYTPASEAAPTPAPAWGWGATPASEPAAGTTEDAGETPASETAPTPAPAWGGWSATPAPAPAVSKVDTVIICKCPPPEPVECPCPPYEPIVCQCPQPREPATHRLGMRGGLGVSALRDHKALHAQEFDPYAIVLKPAFAASAGLVYAFDLTGLISLTAELQYSYYSAHGEFSVKWPDTDFGDLNIAGANLHTVELPILARANLAAGNVGYYVELGPMLGYNLYSQVYKNSALHKPYLNGFAFGISVGGGVWINDFAMLGIRWNFGLLEYAENSNGRPWAAQLGVTKFFF